MNEWVARESVRRPARNLAGFREVNNGIGDLAQDEFALFVCECGSQECFSTLELRVDEYRRIRSNPTWAIVIRGHELDEVENVVGGQDGFLVVERLMLAEASSAVPKQI